jgi:hypothetical protein
MFRTFKLSFDEHILATFLVWSFGLENVLDTF